MDIEQELENSLTNSANKSQFRSINSDLSKCHSVSTSSRLTNTHEIGVTTTECSGVSIESENWNSPLKAERKSGFVTLNPFTLFLVFRNAKILTVEPVIFLYMFGVYLYLPLLQQYFFLQFAKNIINNSSLLPNSSYCLSTSDIDHYGGNGSSVRVQTLSGHLGIYITLANQIPSIICTLIYGPLSDRIGRKPTMLFVAVGAIIQGLLVLGIVHWELSIYFFILTGFITGIGGDFGTLLMSCFSFISDVSTVKWRTYRIGVAEAMMFLAAATAEGTGGIWFEKLNCNFLPPVGLYIGSNVLLIAYVLLFLPESLTQGERQRRALNKHSDRGRFDNLVRGFKMYFGQLTDFPTWKLWACLISSFILVMTGAGAQRIAVYFLKTGDPFDLDPATIGYFQMTGQVSHMLSLLVVLPILVVLKFPDALLAIIGLAFNAGMNIFTGLAKLNYELFIIAAVQGVEAIVFPPLRSIQSKAVDLSDQGMLFSIIASVELAGTLVSGLVFPVLIPVTLGNGLSPGIVFLLIGSLSVIPLPLLLLLLFCRKRNQLCKRPNTSTHKSFSPEVLASSKPETERLLLGGSANKYATYPKYTRTPERCANRTGAHSSVY